MSDAKGVAVSVQAMTWALAVPKKALANPSARHVLLVLANYAGSGGRGAFPSAATLSDDTGLSERTVRLKLEELREAGWIVEGNQAIVAAYIERRDRRPVVYDLQLDRTLSTSPRTERGANPAPRQERGAANGTGCSSRQNGVQLKDERGAAAAPNPSLNHQLTREQQQREISDAIAEQEQQALEATDERQRFAMFATWQPDSRHLVAQAQIAGVEPVDIADAVIRSFKGFFVAKPATVDSSGGWCHRLVIWFLRERVKNAGAVAPDEVEASPDHWAAKGVIL